MDSKLVLSPKIRPLSKEKRKFTFRHIPRMLPPSKPSNPNKINNNSPSKWRPHSSQKNILVNYQEKMNSDGETSHLQALPMTSEMPGPLLPPTSESLKMSDPGPCFEERTPTPRPVSRFKFHQPRMLPPSKPSIPQKKKSNVVKTDHDVPPKKLWLNPLGRLTSSSNQTNASKSLSTNPVKPEESKSLSIPNRRNSSPPSKWDIVSPHDAIPTPKRARDEAGTVPPSKPSKYSPPTPWNKKWNATRIDPVPPHPKLKLAPLGRLIYANNPLKSPPERNLVSPEEPISTPNLLSLTPKLLSPSKPSASCQPFSEPLPPRMIPRAKSSLTTPSRILEKQGALQSSRANSVTSNAPDLNSPADSSDDCVSSSGGLDLGHQFFFACMTCEDIESSKAATCSVYFKFLKLSWKSLYVLRPDLTPKEIQDAIFAAWNAA